MENNWLRRRVLEKKNPGRQQPCWGSLFCTNLTQPTGNLDSASSETVMEYLQMINKDMKKTVVLVTHDAYVASFCNRVIFVKDGMIEVELKKTEGQDEFCDQIMKEQKKILKR